VPVAGLPALFDRPRLSPAELADAYLWITVTRGFDLDAGSVDPATRA
jgi:hypothetical protein